jgi:chromosome segregation protein
MYLSRIELFGFKSFPHKVTMEVGQGITAIVGPNGCGKTNIVDAIRWCLGEQSTKSLRSDKMEDVIFNGTRDEKPLSMAEVTLVFSNEEGRLPVEYAEVSVTRRLFRSGESEYLLNNKACRLRDIVDLFLNTGLGADSYSIIESKMIETILSEDPSIRRSLFEEAAGVAKYRQQKKAAQRRMESTAEDLVRIQDIVSEVEKRLRSLRRQAGKARIYERFRAELKELDLKVSARDRERLAVEERELAGRIEQAAARRAELAGELDQREHEITRARELLEENEGQIGQIQDQISEVSEAIRESENRLAVIRERRAGIEQTMQAREQEIRSLLAAMAQYESGSRDIQARMAAASQELLQRTDLLRGRQTELAALDAEISSGRAALSEARRELLESVRLTTENRERLAGLESRQQSAEAELVSLRQEGESLSRELEAQEGQLKELTQRRQELSQALQVLRSEEQGRESEIGRLRSQIEEQGRLLAEASAEAAALEKEKNLLAELHRRREGYHQGVKHLMESLPELEGRAAPLAESIRVKAGCQRAVESLLGEKLHWVAVDDVQTMAKAIKALKSGQCGWATLVPLDRLTPQTKPETSSGQGIEGNGLDFVDCPERLRPLIEKLLGDALIASDGFDLNDLSERHPGRRIANRSGEVAEPWGAMITGSLPSGQFGLLERQQRLAELDQLIAQCRQRQEQAGQKLEESRNRESLSRQALETARSQASQYQVQLSDVSGKMAAIAARHEEGRGRAARITELIKRHETVLLELGPEIARSRQTTLEFDESNRDEGESLAQRDRELSGMDQRREELAAAVSRATLELAQTQAAQEQARQELRNMEARRTEAIEHIQQLRNLDEEASRSIAQLKQEDESISLELRERSEQRELVLARREAQQQQRQQSLSLMKTAEEALHRTRLESEELQNVLSQAQLELGRVANDRENLKRRLAEEYETELEELPAAVDIDLEQARPRISDLRLRIKKLGGINFDALKELEEEEQRFGFMAKQRDDLLAAKEDLSATIKRIDEEARAMFLQTLEGIKTGFVQIFQRLFIGGEADIRLTGSQDPLEAEIEIMATPMGKNMKSITLLSGGEKALTAIAMLFGIYLVKPAPFCVLDEIDAPLDDANVQRFCAMLKDFTGSTQFMVITHNKRTMEIADRLYGVTMEQLGVSKVVSVKFQ